MTQKFNNHMSMAQPVAMSVKASTDGQIEGYASVIGNTDRGGDVVLAGAFSKSIQRHKATSEMPVMLWAHAQEQPIGKWTDIGEDDRGLFVKGQINLSTIKGKDAFESVKAGDVGGLSIGYSVPEGGREYVGKGVFHLKEVDLYEVSVVAVPMNPLARITGVKSLGSKAEAIDMLRECGLSRKAAARFAAGGWKALGGEIEHQQQAIKLASQMDAAIKAMRQ